TRSKRDWSSDVCSSDLPDSFTVTVGPAASRSFADTVVSGGWITAKVFEDLDGNGVWKSGEPWREGESFTVTHSNDTEDTDDTGTALLFSKVGGFTLTLAVPDSFSCETSNPVTGTMTQGGSLT